LRSSFALGEKGFRPFFLLAAVFAAFVLPLWLLVLESFIGLHAEFMHPYWHAHEMVFGFSVAVIAGFLLTAVGNWTGRETVVGVPLLALAALWALGRVAIALSSFVPRGIAAVIDLAFIPALMVGIGRALVLAKNKRNYVMLALLFALWLSNLASHAGALGIAGMSAWQRQGSVVGTDIVLVLILVVSARVVPMFTRNATRVTSIHSLPWLDKASAISMAIFTICDIAIPAHRMTAALAALTGVFVAARSIPWGTRHTARDPLLWILHVGCWWIPIGLVLRAISSFTSAVPSSLSTHALTVGTIGSLTLGMMARVALGHSGRMLAVSKPTTFAFAALTIAGLVRVTGPLFVSMYTASIVVAGVLWSLAFVLYLVVYVPILVVPRVDGRPG